MNKPISHAEYCRIRRFPDVFENAAAKLEGLCREAERYGYTLDPHWLDHIHNLRSPILDDPHHVDRAWEREVNSARNQGEKE